MSKSSSRWHESLLKRFADRNDIGKDRLYAEYFMKDNLPKKEVLECLSLIESEYDLPAGLLRPTDKLNKLFEPVETKNPLLWLIYQTRADDRKSELNYELAKRMRQHGILGKLSKIDTIGEFIRAWCGELLL